MSDFQTDFIQNNGTFMVLADQENFHADRFSKVQCKMISGNKIPGLLNARVDEVDLQVRLIYEITGKKMLSEMIRSGDQLGSMQFYGLLLQIASVLSDCKKYMLKAAHFILDSPYMFMSGSFSSGTVYLTYVPMADFPLNKGASSFLAFVMGLVPSVSGLDGRGLQQIVKMCASPELFSFTLMKELLLRLLEGDEKNAEEAEIKAVISADAPAHAALDWNENAALAGESFTARNFAAPGRRERIAGYSNSNNPFNADAFIKQADRMEHRDQPGLAAEQYGSEHLARAGGKLNKTYIILAALLLSALGWKLIYLDHPSTTGLLGAAGLTLAAGIGSMLVLVGKYGPWFGISKQRETKLKQAEDGTGLRFKIKPEAANKQGPFNRDDVISLEAGAKKFKVIEYLPELSGEQRELRETTAGAGNIGAEGGSIGVEEGNGNGGSSDFVAFPVGKTELLSAPRNATMLLDQDQAAADSTGLSSRYGYLERTGNHIASAETINLSPGSFVIGRSAEVVQFLETASGTSRAHVEVLVNDRRWQLKDLGSKNGTKLNGESMVPYKDYPLEPGDEFSIADVNYKLFS